MSVNFPFEQEALQKNFNLFASLGQSRNLVPGVIFGRNPSISTGTVPEDIYNGGGVYTGFNAVANDALQAVSDNANDVGTLVSSGTAENGSAYSLFDSNADFTGDGVAAGDCVINDTLGCHGIVTGVTANTLTVRRFIGENRAVVVETAYGNAYRVVNASGTGASVFRALKVLDADFNAKINQYFILNGVTPVNNAGNYARTSMGEVVHAATRAGSLGAVTCRQATTTSNIFMTLPAGRNKSTVGADTVPADRIRRIKRARVTLSRANGSPGSANVVLESSEYGEPYRDIRNLEITNGSPTQYDDDYGDIVGPGSDLKFECLSVSDNNTIIEAAVEYEDMLIQ